MVQHYQAIVLADDIGTAITISSIIFVSSYSESLNYVLDFTLSLAPTESQSLSTVFSENYEPGTLIEVFQIDSLDLAMSVGGSLIIEFDTPYFYDGQDNLLLDIYYPDGCCYFTIVRCLPICTQ